MYKKILVFFYVFILTPTICFGATLGKTTIASTNGNGANVLIGNKHTLSENGNFTSISVYCSGSCNIKVAIYAVNGSGVPTDLLVANNDGEACSAGWNTIDITQTFLAAGDYALALVADTASVLYYEAGAAAQLVYKTSFTYATDFPSTFPTPTGYQSNVESVYATYSTDYITLDETTDSMMDRRVIAYDADEEGSIQLSGLYGDTTPTHVEARVFNRTTTSTVQINSSDWTQLTSETISGGSWSGTLSEIPKTNAWLGIEVRISNATSITYEGDNKIGVGYVVAYTGQSYIGYWTLYGPYTPSDTETSNDLCSKFRHSDATRPSCDGNAHSVTVPFEGWELNTGDGSIIFANKLQSELDCPIGVLDYGHGGAALLETNKSGSYGYWFGTTGSENWLEDFEDAVDVSEPISTRRKANAFIWYHGYTDCHAGEGYQDYYDTMEDLFADFRTAVNWSSCPIFVVAQPRAADDTINDQSFTDVRLAQYDICMDDNEQKNIFAGQAVDLALHTDNVHLSESAQEAEALRYAQTVLWHEGISGYNYHRGPHCAGWSIVDSTTLDIYLSHDGGSDITPSSNIDSFEVYIGSTWYSATGARQAHSTIRLTHTSGTVTNVRCLYGRSPDISYIVKDNSTLTLPIEALGDFSGLAVSTARAQIY